MTDTIVFIPAWNEEQNLPAVLDDLKQGLPDADVLVVDDGSTDGTADVAREHGAEVLSFGVNRGLTVGIASGYRWALDHGYAFCGRVDADGQHPVHELARLLAMVKEDRCDVAVGSRFVSGDGYAPFRYNRRAPPLPRRSCAARWASPPGRRSRTRWAASRRGARRCRCRSRSRPGAEVEALIRIATPASARGGAGEHGRACKR
jgi:glycosyltransferase involved in cell wall biosynthesis